LTVADGVAGEPRGSRRAAIAIQIDRPEIGIRRSDSEDRRSRFSDGEALQRSVLERGHDGGRADWRAGDRVEANPECLNRGWRAEWLGVSSRGAPPAASTIQIASFCAPYDTANAMKRPLWDQAG
jgi:hypothetical protein